MKRRLRDRLTYANVMSTLALFVALGGASYAAVTIGKGQVKSRNIARGAVKSKHVSDFSLGANDLQKGVIPTAPASTSIPAQEAFHDVGQPGEPAFQNSWVNLDPTNAFTAGFYKDGFGEVHLRGLVTGGTSGAIFQLPPGYRPGKLLYLASTTGSGTHAELSISFSGIVSRNSFVAPSGAFYLDGATFRAGA
jgi:hypothetical protein